MNDLKNERRRSLPSVAERDLLSYDLLSCIEPYDPDTVSEQLYASHQIEIALVTEGRGIHQSLNQAVPCKAGDVYIVSPEVPHGYFALSGAEPMTVRRLRFDPLDWFDGEAAEKESARYCYGVFRDGAVVSYAMLNAETELKIKTLYDAISLELREREEDWSDAVRAHLRLTMIAIGRYVNGAIKASVTIPPKEWRILRTVLQTVAERFPESDLTLEGIAERVYVSKSYLSRIFQRYTGKHFSEYLRSVRLKHACVLLRTTALTVEEIVRACGLKDVPSFYRSFHAYTEVTPTQFRNQYSRNYGENQKGDKIMIVLSEISENLQRGKAKLVKEMVQTALDEGCDPERILNEGLLSGMNVIGEKFKNNEVYVPEVLVAARAMNMGMQVLKPALLGSGVKANGRVCIGTVQGDLHDIGKNLVRMMLEGKGLEVVDLGVDVAPETFVQTAIEQNCNIICCSALLTTTMGVMRDVVKAAEDAGVRDRVKIMVGGAPVTEAFCREIGADVYTSDAASAADAALALCREA